jgi:hypothetical protein
LSAYSTWAVRLTVSLLVLAALFARALTDTFRRMRVFPATVAGGDIVVCAMPPLRAGRGE